MLHPPTRSYWQDTTPLGSFPRLNERLNVDVAIIGGGITGLTSAYILKQSGMKVAVLEEGLIARGETGRSTAHITEILDTRFHALISRFGKKAIQELTAANRLAINRVSEIVEELEIDCAFRRLPGFLYAEDPEQANELSAEVEAASTAGVELRWTDDVPLPFATHGGLRIENQAAFHPGAYCHALARAIQGGGSYVFERSPVEELVDGEPCQLYSNGTSLSSSFALIATHFPSIRSTYRLSLQTKVAAYRTYALGARLSRDIPVPGLFWDASHPYHYSRPHNGIWLIGGSDHKTGHEGEDDGAFARLEDYARSRFSVSSIPFHWSGQILETVDGLPYIGLNASSENVYVATGFSGNGISYGTLAAMIISDEIREETRRWTDLLSILDPTRIKPLAAARTFISENKDYPVQLVADSIRRIHATRDPVSEIPRGEARIVQVNGEDVAAYHDEKGEFHTVSATCTHLGCQVHWNSAERSWDCPCHGSRFGVDGAVLNGPATRALPEIQCVKKTRAA